MTDTYQRAAELSAAHFCNIFANLWYQCAYEYDMKGLRKFDFTIEEYLKDPNSVLARAMGLVTNQLLSERDVQHYLEGKCRQKMMDSMLWDEPVWPIIESGFMSCSVYGRVVEFFVRVTPRQMDVSLLRDGSMIRKSIELDSSSSAIFTESPYEITPISEYGLQKAKLLAVDLYYGK